MPPLRLIFAVSGAIVGIVGLAWGMGLVHATYLHELNVVYMWKVGTDMLPDGLEVHHAEQAAKMMVAHVGLIVLSTFLIFVSIAAAFWPKRSR